jgi:hypothetical protein
MLLVGVGLGVFNFVTYWLWSTGMISTSEDGFLEVGQNIFLLLACLLHSYHSRQEEKGNLYRDIHAGMALFCFVLLLREVDIDQLGSTGIWEDIEMIIRGVTLVGILIYAAHMMARLKLIRLHIHALLTSPMIILTILGCAIYSSSWPFDKMIFAIPTELSIWAEETLELTATIVLLLAAYSRDGSDQSR